MDKYKTVKDLGIALKPYKRLNSTIKPPLFYDSIEIGGEKYVKTYQITGGPLGDTMDITIFENESDRDERISITLSSTCGYTITTYDEGAPVDEQYF